MKNFKKILRVLGLIVLMLMALSGIGFIGALFSNNRERYQNKKITIEMVDENKTESENQVTDAFQAKE